MSAVARGARVRTQPAAGFLFGWLLVALFLEYARPASFFPFLNIPFFYSLIPLLLFIASLFASGLRSAKDAFSDPLAKWIFMLLGVVFLSMLIFWSYAIDTFTSVLGYVMLFSVIARICTTWDRIRRVCAVLIVAHLFLLAMNPQVLLDPGTRHYIQGATFLGDGNDFGLSLCLLFPCALWLAQTSKTRFGKVVAYLCILVMLYAIVATQSRGATLGIGAVMFFLWLQSQKKALGLIAMAVVAIGVLALAPAAYFQRIGTISNPTDGSAQGRLDAWKAGVGMGAKNPIIGVGAGHFGPRWGKTAHSTYVLAFGELGIPGFICVIAIVIGNVRVMMSLRRRVLAAGAAPPIDSKDGKDRRGTEIGRSNHSSLPDAVGHCSTDAAGRALLMFAAAMLGFGVAGAFLSATYYPHMYVLTGLMIAARAIAARESGVPLNNTSKSRVGFRNGQTTPAQP